MAIHVLLSPHDVTRFALRTKYNPAFVEALKDTIPPTYRDYNPATKEWYVHEHYGKAVLTLVQAHGGWVTDNRPQAPTSAPVPRPLDEACTLLGITPNVPLSVAEAVFKAQARLHHPDVGGDTEMMQRLVNALETFKAFTEGSR